MGPSDVAGAIDAAMSIAMSVGLPTDNAIVLHNSNKLALRLLPCDVFARVSGRGHEHARFEIELAQRLADAGGPVAALEPRVEPRGYRGEGFEVTFWTYYEPVAPQPAPLDYAGALVRLHAGMRTIDLPTPHFTERVTEAEQLVASHDRSPKLSSSDRRLLTEALQQLGRSPRSHGVPEQLLHGEPHPGNVLDTADGPLFIDFETCCRGPVEFDLAHVPAPVAEHAPDVDLVLLDRCRQLVLAMVAAWRWDRDDQFPNGIAFGGALVRALRAGPPYPTIDAVFDRIDAAQSGYKGQ